MKKIYIALLSLIALFSVYKIYYLIGNARGLYDLHASNKTQKKTSDLKFKENNNITHSNGFGTRVDRKKIAAVKVKDVESRTDLVKKYSRYTPEILALLKKMSQDKVAYDDPGLIQLAKKLIDLPADDNMVKFSRNLIKTPQAEFVDTYLKEKTNGFFVECGALDGERSSNSLFFEKERKWTGLLVEMDPYFYLQLLGKNRRSFSINACLSPHPYVSMISYIPSQGGLGRLNTNETSHRNSKSIIACFPLSTLLLALNIKKVDFFSLDVEGFELPILKTILPKDQFDIDTLAVEYAHGKKEELKNYLVENRFNVVKDIIFHDKKISLFVDDFIAVKEKK